MSVDWETRSSGYTTRQSLPQTQYSPSQNPSGLITGADQLTLTFTGGITAPGITQTT